MAVAGVGRRQFASQLRVLHAKSSHFPALHLYIRDGGVILLLKILDHFVLALVLRNGCEV